MKAVGGGGPSGEAWGPLNGTVHFLRKFRSRLPESALLPFASRNGVGPFLYRHFREQGGGSAGTLEGLHRLHLAALAANGSGAGETWRLLDILGKEGIEAIPLKGALASQVLFGDEGLYQGSDIDLLVRPSDLAATRELLVADGYFIDPEEERAKRSYHYHVNFTKGRHHLEVHWKLAKRPFEVPPERWWDGVFHERAAGGSFLSVSPERYLGYAAVRLHSHEFFPLKFLYLVDGLVGRYGGRVDWEGLMGFCRRYRMERLMRFTLWMAADLFGTAVPEEVIGGQGRFFGRAKEVVLKGIFEGPERPYLRKAVFLTLLDGPGNVVQVAWKSLFPGRGEMQVRFGLREGSPKVFLCYALSALLLPVLLLRRRRDLRR